MDRGAANLTGMWVGSLTGTNVGQLQVHLQQSGDKLHGEAILEDVQFGKTVTRVSGRVREHKISADLTHFRGSAPIFPTTGHLDGELSQDHSQITGQWGTNIATGGTFTLKRDSGIQPAMQIPAERAISAVTPQPITVTPPAPQTLVVDFKNVPIESFNISVNELQELATIFSRASEKARELEEQVLAERHPSGPQRQIQIASIPAPSIELTGEDGRFLFFSEIREFDSSKVPSDLKSIHFNSYKQGGYFPSHGVQIHISNVNGLEPQNAIGLISVHGSDTTWVMGTFESVKQFFSRRRTGRAWLHRPVTGQLVLYGLVFPMALWLLFRIMGLMPATYVNLLLIQFGLFVYLYGACYLGFDKLLVYLRWTLPLYEIQCSSSEKRKRHRVAAWTIFAGIFSAFLWDFLKIILIGK